MRLPQLAALHIQFVQSLVVVFADRDAGRLFLLDGGIELGELQLDLFRIFADLLHVAQAQLFRFPLLAQAGQLVLELGDFLFDLGQPVLRGFLGLFGQLPSGQFQLAQPALDFVDLRGDAFQFHRQAAGRFVHQVDGLVGQEAVGDVAVRQLGGRDQRGVLDLHAVMGFVARLQPAQNARSCPRPTARRRTPAGSAVRARRPFRCACDTHPASWRRCSAVRRGPGPA